MAIPAEVFMKNVGYYNGEMGLMLKDSVSSARVTNRNSPRRWLHCLRTSSGISSVICRPIR